MEIVLAGGLEVVAVVVGGEVDGVGGADMVEEVVVDVVVVFSFDFVEVAIVVGLVKVVEVRVGKEADVAGVDKVSEGDGVVVVAEKAMPTRDAKMARRNDILEAKFDVGGSMI